MTESIRALLFDLGGVVFEYRPERRLAAFAAQTGLSPGEIEKRLFISGFAQACDEGRIKTRDISRRAAELLDSRLSQAQFADLWGFAFRPNADVIELVRRIKRRHPGPSTALITNNTALLRDHLHARYPNEMALFRPQVFSADVGATKPSPRIFRTALSILDVAPEHALVIDDTDAHVFGAEALGLRGIAFRDARQLAHELSGVLSG